MSIRWFVVVLASIVSSTSAAESSSALAYPPTRKAAQVDDYHGTQVADPYRWLEDTDSPETRAWIEAQNRLTFDYLGQIPERESLRQRLTELWNYERFGVPSREGSRYFVTRNNGLQNQDVLYTLDRLDAEPRLLLDPNTLTADGTVALTSYAVSGDGEHLAYGLSAGGSDWEEWRVRRVRTGVDTGDVLQWVKFSFTSWSKDNQGFYYCRYDEPAAANRLQSINRFHKLYYHRLGTPQSEDRLVYHRPDQKDWTFRAEVSEDGRYIILAIRQGSDVRRRIYYAELKEGKEGTFQPLIDNYDASYTFIGNEGPVFWLLTDLDAPRRRLIAVDTRQPEPTQWRTLIPEGPSTLESVQVVNRQFVAQYLQDARSAVRIFDLTGQPRGEIELPGLGTAVGFTGRSDARETFYSFTSFTVPRTIYRHDFESGRSSVFRAPKLNFDPRQFETRQIFYASKDGTSVPMFVVHRRGLDLNGQNPTLLYGYGGFNIVPSMAFTPFNLVWLERGGVYAQASLRGGGEYGKEWHHAGMKARKQNVFDDFIAAAEWLIKNRVTQPARLAISGRSNGGLLVGACMTQRPELFGAALPAVGVMDMLRFHKFTIGWAWTSDFGSPDNPEEFPALFKYSPLQNLKPGTRYPATLVTTADHDDRVVPGHSFKFAAALQAAQSGPAPTLIRIDTKAGHGAGKPTGKLIEEAADVHAFLIRTLGLSAGEAGAPPASSRP